MQPQKSKLEGIFGTLEVQCHEIFYYVLISKCEETSNKLKLLTLGAVKISQRCTRQHSLLKRCNEQHSISLSTPRHPHFPSALSLTVPSVTLH